MARRGRSIGIVGDAYVPVPFKELMQSNLLKEQAYESAEEDILETETLLGATGATPGDEAFIRELEENFTTGFQTSLEETGNDLIGSSQFLQKQLGKITKAIGVTESNKKSRSDFHTAIDKANLDPHIAQYKKMEADAVFDKAGGSKAGVGFAPTQFVDFNGKEATELLMKFAKEVSKDTSIDYVYEHYNTAGQDIFELKRILNSTEDPEEKQALLDKLGQGWDIPDPNINEGQPILNKQKTTAKHKNKIYNKIAPTAFDNPLLKAYFQESTDASNFNSLLQDPESEPAEMADVFNDAIMNVANMMEVSLQEDSQSFMFEQETSGSDKDKESDSEKTPSSFKTATPPITQYPVFDMVTTTSSADMRREIMSMPPDVMNDADKYFYNSLIDVARTGTNEGVEIDFTEQLKNAVNNDPLFEEYFVKEDGTVDIEKIDSNNLFIPRWVNEQTVGKTENLAGDLRLRGKVVDLKKRLSNVYDNLLESQQTEQGSFTDNIENMRNKIDHQVELLTVDDTKAGKENTLALNILTDPNLNEGGVFREEANKFEKKESIPSLSNALISGVEKYPVKIDGEEYRGVQIKAKGTKANAPFLTYRVRMPEAQYQSSLVNSGVMKDFNPDYQEYKGVDKDQIRNISQAPNGAKVMLPQTEAIFNQELDMYLNEQGLDITDREFKAFIERKAGAEPYNLQIGVRIGGDNPYVYVKDDVMYETEQSAGYAINTVIDAILKDYRLHLIESYSKEK